ncbi:MAG: hypothetical protein U0491_02665 [Candidatus Saccharimonadales bacterium]
MAEVQNTEEQTPKTPEQTTKTTPKKSTSNKTLFIIIGVVGVAVLLLAGFGLSMAKNKLADKTASGIISTATGGKVSVDSNGKDVTVKTADGSTYSSSQKLPTDWPSSVPLYTPYSVTGSYKASNDGKTAWHLATSTSDSYDKVVAEIPKLYSGWTSNSSYESNGAALFSYDNSTYGVILSVAKPDSSSNNKVTVSYTVSQK